MASLINGVLNGTATTANKLGDATVGTTGTPIYLENGVPKAITMLSGFNIAATTAVTLLTPRSINGTAFNGSADITTSYWGTTRNFTIYDYSLNNNGGATAVNGNAAVSLKLPSNIVASIVGNASTASALYQSVSLWGQTFNGSTNIVGALTNVTNITATGTISAATLTSTGGLTVSGSSSFVGASKFNSALDVAGTSTLNKTVINPSTNLGSYDEGLRINRASASSETTVMVLGGPTGSVSGINSTTWTLVTIFSAGAVTLDRNDYTGINGFSINNSGNMGIGYPYTSIPTYKLAVNGNAHFAGNVLALGGVAALSSRKLKDNIVGFNGLNILEYINPVKYDWNNEGLSMSKSLTNKHGNYGVIAEEVKEVFPSAVIDGEYLTVDYSKFIPVLMSAVKILNQQFVAYKSELELLKDKIKEMEAKILRLERINYG